MLLWKMGVFLFITQVTAIMLPSVEPGYTVSTVFDLRKHSANAYSLYPDPRGEFILALDSTKSRILQLTLPLSQNSSLKHFAGSTTGKTGYVDGSTMDALFNRPQSLVIGDNGDVYVADTANFAIRKISKGQVTTIAGGSSQKAGYVDGPGEIARFSNDFILTYWCGTLLISDRGNRVIRKIQVDTSGCSSKGLSFSGAKTWLLVSLILLGVCVGIALGIFIHKRMTKPEWQEDNEHEREQALLSDSSDEDTLRRQKRDC